MELSNLRPAEGSKHHDLKELSKMVSEPRTEA